MASVYNNILLEGASGALGKQIVIKNYNGKTVITAYPDMSRVKPSKHQKTRRNIFKEAVAYAQAINNDLSRKVVYKKKLKKGQSVYHAAIAEFMSKHTASAKK
jgi:molybdenum cofactor biosynthesis enzyme